MVLVKFHQYMGLSKQGFFGGGVVVVVYPIPSWLQIAYKQICIETRESLVC